MTPPQPLLVGVREAARELGIGRDAAYQLVHEGRLRVVRVSGRRLLVPRNELRRFIEREVAEGGDAYESRDEGTAGPDPNAP